MSAKFYFGEDDKHMTIRNATQNDVSAIEYVYECARGYMRSHGNMTQWLNGYPYPEVIDADIKAGNLYVVEDDEGIYGVFAFVPGEDPTYAVIENGSWLNSKPYHAIHRVASSGRKKGVFEAAFEFCSKRADQLRIDTHADNLTMQNAVEKCGFVRCGTIYTWDSSPRIAYHFDKNSDIK